MLRSLVGSEMCIRDSLSTGQWTQGLTEMGSGSCRHNRLYQLESLVLSARSQELRYTNYTETFKGCIDYIWGTPGVFSLVGAVQPVPEVVLATDTALPNAIFSSDHLLIGVDLFWTPRKLCPDANLCARRRCERRHPPDCKYHPHCTSVDCRFSHRPLCRLQGNCPYQECRFFHLTACRQGAGCTNPKCLWMHPAPCKHLGSECPNMEKCPYSHCERWEWDENRNPSQAFGAPGEAHAHTKTPPKKKSKRNLGAGFSPSTMKSLVEQMD
eukprot:TRINITY_DN28321_c0_g1_i1.p1 TRINITY_DN28321_c0_g1~~TRINITY_DN28321_c0_g1_i1.p1  ORF type:complete len:269 (-),score=37.34 TRINITY_DN28321_c0_g1_i1:391-1197(-)